MVVLVEKIYFATKYKIKSPKKVNIIRHCGNMYVYVQEERERTSSFLSDIGVETRALGHDFEEENLERERGREGGGERECSFCSEGRGGGFWEP